MKWNKTKPLNNYVDAQMKTAELSDKFQTKIKRCGPRGSQFTVKFREMNNAND